MGMLLPLCGGRPPPGRRIVGFPARGMPPHRHAPWELD
ncbi:hypothetical protein KCH_28760 [Kitasatospora cheerisanensis KCTC 2395]|uniref:Uncharacterized protein n=1 Tax=Kitasatospora cheerisanensis KCTC 2395 TaxID=1348663 RepID=A0A066Z565_9ACTN|nr:hypothetical protein KCH_28760 [Kitasatospora cheerisanensis KCTC 2395]